MGLVSVITCRQATMAAKALWLLVALAASTLAQWNDETIPGPNSTQKWQDWLQVRTRHQRASARRGVRSGS
jgi:hypothetical protein